MVVLGIHSCSVIVRVIDEILNDDADKSDLSLPVEFAKFISNEFSGNITTNDMIETLSYNSIATLIDLQSNNNNNNNNKIIDKPKLKTIINKNINSAVLISSMTTTGGTLSSSSSLRTRSFPISFALQVSPTLFPKAYELFPESGLGSDVCVSSLLKGYIGLLGGFIDEGGGANDKVLSFMKGLNRALVESGSNEIEVKEIANTLTTLSSSNDIPLLHSLVAEVDKMEKNDKLIKAIIEKSIDKIYEGGNEELFDDGVVGEEDNIRDLLEDCLS